MEAEVEEIEAELLRDEAEVEEIEAELLRDALRGPTSYFETRGARPTVADYVHGGAFTVTTRDDDDHTFHGIVFDVELTGTVPIEWLDVTRVSVRGALGVTRVLAAPGGFEPAAAAATDAVAGAHASPIKPPNAWIPVFEDDVAPAPAAPRDLRIDPVRLRPGAATRVGLYVHSEHADGVVYNNQRHRGVVREDAHVRILSGVAHTGGAPFARVGYWGDVAWRPRREFVGNVAYDVRLLLWTPDAHARFPAPFRSMVVALLGCRANHVLRGGARRAGLGDLPLEALYYALAFARHDWVEAAAPAAAARDDGEPWEVRRDAYGSRVLVPKSQCADEDDDDDDAPYGDDDDDDGDEAAYYDDEGDFDDDDAAYGDDDDDRDLAAYEDLHDRAVALNDQMRALLADDAVPHLIRFERVRQDAQRLADVAAAGVATTVRSLHGAEYHQSLHGAEHHADAARSTSPPDRRPTPPPPPDRDADGS